MLRVLHQSAEGAIVALVPRRHFARETRDRNDKVRPRETRRKQQLHEVRTASLRVNTRILTTLATEVLGKIRRTGRGERLLARLLQETRDSVQE